MTNEVMAAPTEISCLSLSGRWSLNRSLSDSQETMLQHLGMPFFVRKAMAYAKITSDICQYVDSKGISHIDSKQSSMGRVASIEPRTADWAPREQNNTYLGIIRGRCRIISKSSAAELSDLDHWLIEGSGTDNDLIQSEVTNSERGWVWMQIWGFEEIDGRRYHTRRLRLEKGDLVLKSRLVYDWEGSVPSE